MLRRKAFRAIWENKKAYLACVILVCVGIMTYECFGIAAYSLVAAKDHYYSQYRLADVFAQVKSLPKSDIDRLRSVPGISDVSGRQVYEARAVMPENDKIIIIRLVSADPGLVNPLNGILISGGAGFQNENDIMVNSGFLKANDLEIGDSLRLIINGQEHEFNICAIAQSPDYVSVVRENDPIPDEGAFGIAYIQEKTLFALTNCPDIYNDLSFQLAPGYVYDDIKPMLEDALDRFGVLALYPKKDQISYATLDSKIAAYVSLGQTLPFVFVFMSVVILYLMLKRVIEMDRTQIGALKGIGYTGYEIVGHYMIYGGVTGFVGGALGCATGYRLAKAFLGFVGSSYHLPELVREGVLGHMAAGILIAVVSGLLGSLAGAANIIKLNPAEAMRPPAPKTGKTRVGKLYFLNELLFNSRGSIAIRDIARNKLRSSFVVIGIMFSYGILTLMSSYASLIDDMLTSQFTKVELYDGKISLVQPAGYNEGVSAVSALPGVTAAEGILEIPVEFKHNNLRKSGLITGLAPDAALYKIHDDARGVDLPPPEGGLILSNSLADDLDAKTGDVLYLSSPLVNNDVKVIVSDIAVQGMGQGGYMEIASLAGMFGLDAAVTSVVLDANDIDNVRVGLSDAKNVSDIQITSSTIANYRQLMAPVSKAMIFLVLMAVVVAFAIIYNTSAISLSEQKREYSTLRVLGLYVGEVAEILKFENWILCAAGMVLGVAFARVLTLGISGMIDMDPFTFPTDTPFYAYLIGLAGCVAAVYLSNRSSIRNIKKFELAEVLKDLD